MRHSRDRVGQTSGEGPKPESRQAYLDAVARYERGILAFQERDYGQATEMFQSILKNHPEEKELHERVRLYISVCERHQSARRAAPQNLEEFLLAATLAINTGAYKEAAGYLEHIRSQNANHDQALYMLAVVQTQQGNLAEASELLQRAVEVNPENRSIARYDPDLSSLRAIGSIRGLLEPPGRTERRRTAKTRGAR